MPIKTKIEANEIVVADVNFVSLVPRGANRSPIKIQKQEEQTNNNNKNAEKSHMSIQSRTYENILKSIQPPETKPEVHAVVISKSADQEGWKKILKAQGFSVDVVDESNDQVVVYKQEGFSDTEQYHTANINAEVNCLVTNLQKAVDFFEPGRGMVDDVKADMFLPSMRLILDKVSEEIWSAYRAVEGDKGVARENIKKAMDGGAEAINVFLDMVPDELFKLEDVEMPSAPTKESGSKTLVDKSDDTLAKTQVVEKTTAEGETIKSEVEPIEKNTSTGVEGGDPSGAEDTAITQLATQVGALASAINKQQETLDTMQTALGETQASAAQAETLAKSASALTEGFVNAGGGTRIEKNMETAKKHSPMVNFLNTRV